MNRRAPRPALAISDPTRYVKWYRIEAKLQDRAQTLDLYAGTLARYAERELVGRLVAPEPELRRDLSQIQQSCVPTWNPQHFVAD